MDCEKCVWASHILKRSSLTKVKDMTSKVCSMILRAMFHNLNYANVFEYQPHLSECVVPTVMQCLSNDFRYQTPSFFSCKSKKVGTRLMHIKIFWVEGFHN